MSTRRIEQKNSLKNVHYTEDFNITKMNWSTGILIATKKY
jgi:hypothetical protein